MKLEQNEQLDNPMGRKYLYPCPFKVLMRFLDPFSYAHSHILDKGVLTHPLIIIGPLQYIISVNTLTWCMHVQRCMVHT